jgi:F1F0 ATPase subunit 2
MNESMSIILALPAGVFLGAVFFGGLWWTIRRSLSSEQPALWFGGSLLLRTAAVLAGFYLVAQSDWRRLLACLLGFWLARIVVTQLTQLKSANGARPMRGPAP